MDVIGHFEVLPEGDGGDVGVLGVYEEGADGAMGGDDDVFVGAGGDGLVDGRSGRGRRE